jgi:hypothetical protein
LTGREGKVWVGFFHLYVADPFGRTVRRKKENRRRFALRSSKCNTLGPLAQFGCFDAKGPPSSTPLPFEPLLNVIVPWRAAGANSFISLLREIEALTNSLAAQTVKVV